MKEPIDGAEYWRLRASTTVSVMFCDSREKLLFRDSCVQTLIVVVMMQACIAIREFVRSRSFSHAAPSLFVKFMALYTLIFVVEHRYLSHFDVDLKR